MTCLSMLAGKWAGGHVLRLVTVNVRDGNAVHALLAI
jgi:hypothetical protein